MPKPKKIPKEKLVAFAREHLYYEIRMLFGVTKALRAGVTDFYVYNALLESFVIHASVLLDFFYKPSNKPDDAKAIHYLKSIKDWNATLLPYAKYFKKFNRKRNKWVMHLSYKRLEVAPHEKRWDSYELTGHIHGLFKQFLAMAEPGLLDPKLQDLARFWEEE